MLKATLLNTTMDCLRWANQSHTLILPNMSVSLVNKQGENIRHICYFQVMTERRIWPELAPLATFPRCLQALRRVCSHPTDMLKSLRGHAILVVLGTSPETCEFYIVHNRILTHTRIQLFSKTVYMTLLLTHSRWCLSDWQKRGIIGERKWPRQN